ncbi:MAG: hypothetical protein IPG04_02135 [Polyangiaceae bacterium]|jgi:alpha-tubulin suppressor-like RCC1 family protein|nr:hypothetical protein [Polyangiaceae bacterium]
MRCLSGALVALALFGCSDPEPPAPPPPAPSCPLDASNPRFVQIENVSNDLMVARRSDGTLWCWGFDDMGVCGGGSFPWAQPSDVDCVSDFSVDGFAVAQHPDGSLTVWGGSTTFVYGEDPALELLDLPAEVVEVTAGGGNLLVLDESGTAWFRGMIGFSWRYGDSLDSREGLSPLPFAAGARRLGRGWAPCAIYGDGHAECMGYQEDGQFGIPELDAAREPVALAIDGFIKDLISTRSTCAITDPEGDLFCAGDNSYGQLGSEWTYEPQAHFAKVEGVPPADAVKFGAEIFNTCMVAKGEVWCWGANGFGAIHPSNQGTVLPTRVEPFDDVVDFGLSTFTLCVLREDGSLWCRGGFARGNCSEGFDWTEVSFEECWTI